MSKDAFSELIYLPPAQKVQTQALQFWGRCVPERDLIEALKAETATFLPPRRQNTWTQQN